MGRVDSGMWQHYRQGLKLKHEYIIKNKLVSSKYDPDQIFVQSTDVHRTLASAYSNLAGFYSSSTGTYPNEAAWPSHWTPVPVHTTPLSQDPVNGP
ncbi:hypothetical protein L596_009797 [Steinernema carpocapsae]|uniref:acid phosphatase n=1 Tax=Steinernema carpocapsae TaxID=34508 RepID=A0A4U5PH79_STECR|nr:hypothetical protein L596_009797 [Steinernema carpocapsae]